MLLGYGFKPRPYTYALATVGLVMNGLLAHEKTSLMTEKNSD